MWNVVIWPYQNWTFRIVAFGIVDWLATEEISCPNFAIAAKFSAKAPALLFRVTC